MRGCDRHGVRHRRRRVRSSLLRQQRCHCRSCGSRHDLTGHAGHDVGIIPPLQPAGREARAESLHTAAKRHDGTGQLRPVGMPRPDAAAAAHPGDGVAERAADQRGLFLRRARRKVRPVVPPRRQPAGAKQANGVQRLQEEKDQQCEPTGEPLRRVCGRARTGPICGGGVGFGRSGGRGGHSGPDITPGREASQALFPS